MSKRIAREVAKLEEEATQKLEAEVFRVFERYGNNAADLIKYGSDYEKDLVFRWGYPKAVEEFMELFKVFGPVVFRVAFEKLIYPCVLSDNPDEENEFTVLGIDHAYMQLVYPDLWREFLQSLRPSGIPSEMKLEFDTIRKELEQLKNGIRERMRKEEDKNVA